MNQETTIESYILKVVDSLQFESFKNLQVNMSNTYTKLVIQLLSREVKHVSPQEIQISF